jgi:hypothetical protein
VRTTIILLATGWILWGTVWGDAPGSIDWRALGMFADPQACEAGLQQAQAVIATLEATHTDDRGQTETEVRPRQYRCQPVGTPPPHP